MVQSGETGKNTATLAQALQLGLQYQTNGKIPAALNLYGDILKQIPNQPDALHLSGLCHYQNGDHRKAVDLMRSSIHHNPNNATVHSNLGVALIELSMVSDAEHHFRQAIALQPDHIESHSNLAAILGNQNHTNEAIRHFEIVLGHNSDHLASLRGLAKLYVHIGKTDEALDLYARALRLMPNDADLHTDLAVALNLVGHPGKALQHHLQAISLQAGVRRHLACFATTIENCAFTSTNDALESALSDVLNCNQINPRSATKATLAVLIHKDRFNTAVERISNAAGSVEKLNPADLDTLQGQPLFLQALKAHPLSNLRFERTLTSLRQIMLFKDGGKSGFYVPLIAALAAQCFNNEYVYALTDAERTKVAELDQQLYNNIMADKDFNMEIPAILACYKPLYEYEWAERLSRKNLPNHLKSLFEQQFHEPNQERYLRDQIPQLTGIDDDISQAVRSQYEENPYPRWNHTTLFQTPKPIDETLKSYPLMMDLGDYQSPAHPQILIAGCGTGKHSIDVASRFKDVTILAVDLSLSSLSYARRKTEQLGLTNLTYGQADILKLNELNRQFDLIECGGVLHHMDNPMAGWRVLCHMLKPGGLMKIALYSEIGRKAIVQVRDFIAKQGYKSTADDIRQCRQDILASDSDAKNTLLDSTDFFSLSDCRDLIFHIQEHRFTLLQIEQYLTDLGLEFIDFETTESQKFNRQRNAINQGDKGDRLKNWHAYEQKNPSTFAGMYQFWCRKPQS